MSWERVNGTVEEREAKRLKRFKETFPPEVLELVECLARDNFPKQEIAERLKIPWTSFQSFCEKNKELRDALKNGKEIIDYRVENALLKSALGYKAQEVKIIQEFKNGVLVSKVKEKTLRDVPPSVPAIQMWLHNRLPAKWRKNPETNVEFSGEDSKIQITVVRAKQNGDELEGDEINDTVEVITTNKPGRETSKTKKEK